MNHYNLYTRSGRWVARIMGFSPAGAVRRWNWMNSLAPDLRAFNAVLADINLW